MDGRAWLRRTRERYDVVTLEPMPPYFAGVNSLYSLEFYQLAAARMNPGGSVPPPAASPRGLGGGDVPRGVPRLDHLDPVGRTGILLGRREHGTPPLGLEWPGLQRPAPGRLRAQVIADAVALATAGLARYAALGTLVTDDNQLLAYGRARQQMADYRTGMEEFNLLLVTAAREGRLP